MSVTVHEVTLWCGERIGASERRCGPFDRCGRCVLARGFEKGCPADCPCRGAQAPGVDTWIGPDSSVRGVIEISAPADIRAVVLPAAALARSRWFVHRTGDMEASA